MTQGSMRAMKHLKDLVKSVNATLSTTDNASTITINEDEPFPEVTLSQSHSFAEGTDNY